MKKWMLFSMIFCCLPFVDWAQENQNEFGILKGVVVEVTEDEKEIPLVGANVYWTGTNKGAATDENGFFQLERIDDEGQFEVSYVGYEVFTVDLKEKDYFVIKMTSSVTMEEIKVVHKKKTTEVSYLNPLKTEKIGEKELLKAACCNLSESFETSPSVDVSFTDAVTGTRQIQMLGLAGPYSQITRENMPDIRGMSAIYGLTYVPGTWVESIQLNKGTGSVVNGFESIAGQINIELRKPEESDKVYLNLYGNEGGRLEANANFSHVLKDGKWYTGLLLHGKNNSVEMDRNKDGFLDMPLSKSFIGLNRWKYIGDHGLRAQFGVKATYFDNTGGQIGYDPDEVGFYPTKWGMHLNVERIEGFAKIGKVNESKPWESVGLQISAVEHNQESIFGLNKYDNGQSSYYANFIYSSIIGNTNHAFKTGASIQYDDYREQLNNRNYNRKEIVPGAYFEYAYNQADKFNIVAGLRADYHNIFGAFVTPRLHMRYAFTENTVLRASAGRGQRTANIFSENIGLLASSRDLIVMGDDSDKPYGLEAEVAWNYGVNLSHDFKLDYRNGSIGIDFYRTDFQNQIVVDLDQDPQKAIFYNLEGSSFSNSFQFQIDYEVVKRVDIRLAYRWFDVKTTYSDRLLKKPLIASNRAFINIAYSTRDNFNFDYTLNWQGQKRIPFTATNPVEYRLPENSPDFIQMNVQVSKNWNDVFEIYTGVENLLNYKQEQPILSSDQPFSPYFDSSMVWGPIFGRNVYMGLRYWLK